MTNKQRLELLLNGGVPDTPPHWELVFQIPREMFGIDPAKAGGQASSDPASAERRRLECHIDVCHRD